MKCRNLHLAVDVYKQRRLSHRTALRLTMKSETPLPTRGATPAKWGPPRPRINLSICSNVTSSSRIDDRSDVGALCLISELERRFAAARCCS